MTPRTHRKYVIEIVSHPKIDEVKFATASGLKDDFF